MGPAFRARYIGDAVSEADEVAGEPALCSCGRGYVGHADHAGDAFYGARGEPVHFAGSSRELGFARALREVDALRSMVRADAGELATARGFQRAIVLRFRADLRAARRAGATLGELAADSGLSRQRVAQIASADGEGGS
jgi:hypothetical protein